MRVSENVLRAAVRKILLESPNDLELEREPYEPYDGQNVVGSARMSSPVFGKKYSYDEAGSPECVVVALINRSTEICVPYSQATVKDPVGEGYGRLLTQDEVQQIAQGKIAFWDYFDTSKFSGVTPDPTAVYKALGLFVPTTKKRPAFESTTGAHVKSGEMGCGLDAQGFQRELKKFFSSVSVPVVDVLTTPDFFKMAELIMKSGDQRSLSRIMPCFIAGTTDSKLFGLVQAAIGLLGPYGAMADLAMDAVPGFLVVAYFMHIKQYQLAAYYTIQTVVFMALPAVISRFVGKPILKFLLGAVSIVVILKLARLITIHLLGEDMGIPQAEMDAVINKIQSGGLTIEDLTVPDSKNIFDLQGLQAQYPAI